MRWPPPRPHRFSQRRPAVTWRGATVMTYSVLMDLASQREREMARGVGGPGLARPPGGRAGGPGRGGGARVPPRRGPWAGGDGPPPCPPKTWPPPPPSTSAPAAALIPQDAEGSARTTPVPA